VTAGSGPVAFGGALVCGLATVDVVHVVDTVPGEDEKVVAHTTTVAAGGPGLNAALTSSLLGVGTRLVSAVGHGPLAAVVARDYASCGVALTDLAPPGFEPPVSSVLVTRSTGSRAVVSRNAVGTIDYQDHSRRRVEQWLDDVSAVLVDGHHLPVAVAVAEEARRREVPVLLDGGSWKPGLEELLKHVDIAVVSAAFTVPDGGGRHGDGLTAVLDLGPWWAARTGGERPVRWAGADGASGEVPVPEVDVVDTLGAGDVLHGALLAEVAREGTADLAGALERAVALAARSVGSPGVRGWAEHR
jgi:sugar/nucleoside kinase (ribokinase family)